MSRVRCHACEQLALVRRGKLAKHTADHDGLGWPYDCPGSGLALVDNANRRRQKLRDQQRALGAERQAENDDLPIAVSDRLLVPVTVQQLGAVDLLRQSGLWGADTVEVVSGIFAAGLRDAFRWLQDASAAPMLPRLLPDHQPEKGLDHADPRPPRRRPARARRRVR